MSRVNLVLDGLENREEVKQFILAEAEYVLRDIDFDTDYDLTVKVSTKHGRRHAINYICEISLRRPGIKSVWKVQRTNHQFFTCVRSATESFKRILRDHQEIELVNASTLPVFC